MFSFSIQTRRLASRALLFIVAVPMIATASPPSLRSEEDINDVVDSFMNSMVAMQVGSAYRGLTRYWPDLAPRLTALVSETTLARRELGKALGQSLGSEPVGIERAGERVLRVTRLERFDDGALAWRFLFYRANFAWQLVKVESSEDLRVLFGEPTRTPLLDGEAASRPKAPAESPPSNAAPSSKREPDPDPDYEYEIDIDGRSSNAAS